MTATVTIGTAGHIDHGKTSLVRALTGVDCDRLPEERERGITIELGFAPLDLGSDRVGVVDVPGHERFVRTMLAGAAAIDVGLLVVAADDGVMPQTREHLAILDLLGVRHAVVALAKCDGTDPAWRELVVEEIREALAPTALADAPIVETSAKTGDGIEALREALADAVQAAVAVRADDLEAEPFRLMIDRAFALPGRGTVVTGTAAGGVVRVGDVLTLAPGDRPVRVRELHAHGASVEQAERGGRVAIALAGVHHSDVGRGDELTTPGSVREGAMLAVRVRLLPAAVRSLRPRERVRLHLGTGVRAARVRLLDASTLEPGASGLAMLAVDGPMPAVHGQPFVLRSESPAITIGGGTVLVAAARPLRRSDAGGIARLSALASASDEDRLDRALAIRREPQIARWAAWSDAGRVGAAAASDLDRLRSTGRLRAWPPGGVPSDESSMIHRETADAWITAAESAIARHHAEHPQSAGLRREQLATAARGVPGVELPRALAAAIEDGRVSEVGDGRLAIAGFEPKLTPRHRSVRARLLADYREHGFRPPEVTAVGGPEARRADVDAMVRLCVSEGELVHLGGGVYLDAFHERELRERVRAQLSGDESGDENGGDGDGLTMSQLRVLFDTTRKHAVPFGEYLDRVGLTRRRGDVRVLIDD